MNHRIFYSVFRNMRSPEFNIITLCDEPNVAHLGKYERRPMRLSLRFKRMKVRPTSHHEFNIDSEMPIP